MATVNPSSTIPGSGEKVEAVMDEVGPPPGYPKVATFMGNHPELAIFRRFRGLNARNLLYLQAELVEIENELLQLERADADDKEDARKRGYAKHFSWMLQYKKDDNRNAQYKLMKKMRKKLKKYSKIRFEFASS